MGLGDLGNNFKVQFCGGLATGLLCCAPGAGGAAVQVELPAGSHELAGCLLRAAARRVPSRYMDPACSGRWEPRNPRDSGGDPALMVLGLRGWALPRVWLGKGLLEKTKKPKTPSKYKPKTPPEIHPPKKKTQKYNRPQKTPNSAFLMGGGDAGWSGSNRDPQSCPRPCAARGHRPEPLPSVRGSAAAGGCGGLRGAAAAAERCWAVSPGSCLPPRRGDSPEKPRQRETGAARGGLLGPAWAELAPPQRDRGRVTGWLYSGCGR